MDNKGAQYRPDQGDDNEVAGKDRSLPKIMRGIEREQVPENYKRCPALQAAAITEKVYIQVFNMKLLISSGDTLVRVVRLAACKLHPVVVIPGHPVLQVGRCHPFSPPESSLI